MCPLDTKMVEETLHIIYELLIFDIASRICGLSGTPVVKHDDLVRIGEFRDEGFEKGGVSTETRDQYHRSTFSRFLIIHTYSVKIRERQSLTYAMSIA